MPFISLDSAELNAKSLLKSGTLSEGPEGREERAVRRAAMEFEALFLKQLTAALNPSEEDSDGLFSSNESGFYKQMFSEQLAMAMAHNGGVGLADVIVQRLGGKAAAAEPRGAQRAVDMARLVRETGPAEPPAPSAHGATAAAKTALPAPAYVQPPSEPAAESNKPVQQEAAHPVTLGVSDLVQREVPAALGKAATPHGAPTAVSAPPAANLARNATASSAPFAVALHLPLRGRVSSGFGERHDPMHGRVRRHAGVDIAAPQGTPIAAAAAGKVVFAGRRGGYGNLVEIEHADGQRTRYAHAARLLVQVGDEVKPGQPIATVGSTGRSTGPHLHFEVKKDGARIDPLQAVAKDSKRSRR
jgi:peptidoglycan hydrolase FlgJ